MLEQLLTLSRADSHGLTLQIEKTDLQTLLLEIYENFLPLCAESGHHLNVRLPETEIPLCDSAAITDEKRHHGLGLAVAKEIAAAHKGSLSVSEADGGGALFLLTLPIRHLPSAS